jgi:parallel beta-helix repeat protein
MKKNITQKNIAVVLLILCVCLNMFPVSVGQQKEIKIVVSEDYSGNILYVGGSGSNNYTKIQDAINDSQNGDTVFVYNDSSPYYERIFINKSISLIGEDQQSTIIDGQSSPLTGVTITADSVVLKRFTISHSMYDGIENSVIDISSDAIIISENTISENQVIHDIYFHSSQNCIFSNNTLSEAFFHGIIVSYCINCTFSGNVLYDNYDNFEILDSSNNSFLNNQMTGSDYYHGFFLSHSNSNI